MGADVGACPAPPDAFEPGAEPTERIRPAPGEVTIVQLDLGGLSMGEAAIIVGPDGTVVLLDVGNAGHDDDVREAVRRLNARDLTPARGFPAARGELQVEWIILTHFHGDHAGGLEDLLTGDEPLDVRKGIVFRGLLDVGDALNAGDFEAACGLLTGAWSAHARPLCVSSAPAPCDKSDWDGRHHPATDCPGLLQGSLSDPGDDNSGLPGHLPLGGCARLTFLAAAGFASDGSRAAAGPTFGHQDDNEENARSVAGIIEHGPFRYHFGGDLTGLGEPGIPDVESHLAAVAGPAFWGPLGVDVAHAHHHARRTSSNAALVSRLAPADGRARSVVAGISPLHLGSPQEEVLEAWADGGRLGEGRFWTTRSPGGAEHPSLEVAGGAVVVQTIQGGRGYRIQAQGEALRSRAFRSVR